MKTITLKELDKGCAQFWRHESRDAMYRIAEKLVEEEWSNPGAVADGLGVVLLTWNNAAYRYGSFTFDELERFLRTNRKVLESFRRRDITTFDAEAEAAAVGSLFEQALEALAYTESRRKTPVGVAKALHMLAPSFFPLWDQEIAKGCGCIWYGPENAAAKYIEFMTFAKAAIVSLEVQFADGRRPAGLPAAPNLTASLSKHAGRRKTMLKFLDEYLYARYTKHWT